MAKLVLVVTSLYFCAYFNKVRNLLNSYERYLRIFDKLKRMKSNYYL